jgi:citrate lyase subunit beta/citryl-CoA lyase
VESALGLWNAERLARAPHVDRLAFGALDLALELQVSGDEALAAFRSQLVLLSRVAGLPSPVDVPTTTFTDADVVRTDAARARRMGFGGKLCIHPAQVAPVHEAFAPVADEVAWAHRVLDAAARSAGSATSLDGEMVDRPVVARAEAILARLR